MSDGMFSEDNTFFISAWLAHTRSEASIRNSNFDQSAIPRLPADEFYIFPADIPGSLTPGQGSRGRQSLESPVVYTFKMGN